MPQTNPLISCLFLLFVTSAALSAPDSGSGSNFVEQFQIEPVMDNTIVDRILAHYNDETGLSDAQQQKELLRLNNTLDQLHRKYEPLAVFWFIRGLQHKNMASYFAAQHETDAITRHLNNKNAAFEKAIERSQQANNALSAAIFSTMKPGLPEDLKILATQNEIKSGGNGDNDSYYWYLHWSNIDQLEKAGRIEEAKKAYKKMQRELKNSDMDMSLYSTLTESIERKTFNKTKPSPAPQRKKIKPKKEKRKVEKTPPLDKKYVVIFSVIFFSIGAISFVTLYERFYRHKKRS